MSEIDQKALKGKNQKHQSYVVQHHARRMKEIVAQIGWPMKSKVGDNASNMAWLLVQHADHNIEFQEYCLALMKEAPKGEVSKQNIAYLVDRVNVNRRKPQLYGTQFMGDEHGPTGPQPIHDRGHLDDRRKAMGLEPFEDYQRQMFQLRT